MGLNSSDKWTGDSITKKNLNIPLSKVYMDDEIRKTVLEALDSKWFILGEKVKEFEQKFADFCVAKHAVCTSSGTSALFLLLLALNIKPKDEVIVPSFSFVATASPLLQIGAKPIFADIDPRTYTIDPREIRRKISKRTKAVIPVHLFGHPAEMDQIMEVAEENGLIVVEDACQAHGAEYKGKKVGSIGHYGFFSFYPSKNMTVCGDGGIITTNNYEVAEKVRMLRDHGRREKYNHEILGYNMRFNEIQAAIGLKQLEKLPLWNQIRRRIAGMYSKSLANLLVTPIEAEWAMHVYHMYVVRADERDRLKDFLKQNGISTGIHYPIPIHKQPAIRNMLRFSRELKITDSCTRTVLSLPMYPELTTDEIKYICNKIAEFFQMEEESCHISDLYDKGSD